MTVAIDDGAVVWSGGGRLDGRPLVVLLHGYGEDEGSLEGLAGALVAAGPAGTGTELGTVTAALRGPRPSRDPLPGGRGWYDVDAEIRPEGDQHNETARAVLAWLDETVEHRGTPASVAVIGFSQGGALALHLLRHDPGRFRATVLIAGIWLPGAAPGDAELADLHPAVLWTRTEGDPAIAPTLVAETEAALDGRSTLSHRIHPGDAHALLPAQQDEIVAFLARLL
jgi:phospholipase/carboxylesterase